MRLKGGGDFRIQLLGQIIPNHESVGSRSSPEPLFARDWRQPNGSIAGMVTGSLRLSHGGVERSSRGGQWHHGFGSLYPRLGRPAQAPTALPIAIELYGAMGTPFWLSQAVDALGAGVNAT